jgi:hypothetical protein
MATDFNREAISALVAILRTREASLWHACQLDELAAYLRLGGIGSPSELARLDLVTRPMAPDPADPARGDGTRLIVDLDDVGQGFAHAWRLLPSMGGPITVQLHPRMLWSVATLAVTRHTGSNVEALGDPGAVARSFLRTATDGYPWGERLQPGTRVELAMASPRPVGFEHALAVWVDPVALGDVQLLDRVEGLAEAAGVPMRVRRRTFLEARRLAVWRDLVTLLLPGEKPLLEVWQRADASPEFRAWAAELRAAGLDAAFGRLARGFHRGTLVPLAASVRLAEPAQVAAPVAAGAHPTFPPRSRPTSVYACGHPRQGWDAGTCYACVRDYRSAWRYPEQGPSARS